MEIGKNILSEIILVNYLFSRFKFFCRLVLNGRGGKASNEWTIKTSFDTFIRVDMNEINSSPKVFYPPIFKIKTKQIDRIEFSVIDDNNDLIKCRWANIFNDECSGKKI